MPQRAAVSWQSDMPLAGKLLLSAAALLLLTLAYRFYRSRSFSGGKIPLAEEGEHQENASRDGDEDGDGAVGLRHRRVLGEEVRRDGGDAAGSIPRAWNTLFQGGQSVPRGEEEEEEGEGMVSELGMTREGAQVSLARRESEMGYGLGSKSESKAGIGLDSDLGIEPGNKFGNELRNEVGSELVRGPGNKMRCRLGSKSESNPGIGLDSDPGIEPGSRLGNELQNEVGSEVSSELGSKLGSKSGSKQGIKAGNSPESEMGSKSGSKTESKLGSKLGNESGSELASKPGIKFGSKLGNKSGSKLGTEQGSDLGRETGSKLGSKLGNESGGELGSEPRSKLKSEMGSEMGSEMESEMGSELGSEVGSEVGSELSSHCPGDVTKTLSSHEGKGTLAPGTGLSSGICSAQMAGDGHAHSTEKGLAGGGKSRKSKRNTEPIQTLSVTSNLGLMMTMSDAGSDTCYSFSSVAKIQVEENYIPECQGKDREPQPGPGLKGKVYDYYVQSISESVLKKKSLPYIPPGISRRHSLERVNEELQSFATQKQDPDLAAHDATTSSTAPPPTRSSETSPESPPGRRNSILQIAESPHLQLPMEGFGLTAPAETPPTSPRVGPVPNPDLSQMSPPAHLHLGNCYEVLSSAKAQKLRHLQDAAYKVMSDNYLQVLRTPSIYGRLNAGERELILRRRMSGKPHVVVADVNVQEPGPARSRLCFYDEGGDCWHHLCRVPPEVVSRGCSMCSMFNYLFVVSGCEGTGRALRPSRRVFCYDPLTNVWRELCPLNQARPRCKLVALDGHLYAIGGECRYTVERYDPRRDRWTLVAPLPRDTFAVAHAAAVCDGEIYVTGGTLRCVLLRYQPGLDSWTASPAIGGKDRTAEMVSVGGFIYRFDLRRGAGVSVHRCGAKARLWYECATYTLPDPPGFQCAVLGSLVHCVGRHFHVRFLADHVSPRFGAKELQPFPSPHGSLLPTVLMLPEGGVAQTQV